MLTPQGPRILEFNCRFGDPETQPLLMRLKTDLLELLLAAVEDRLGEFEDKVEWDPRPSVCVVLASQGYPGNFVKGKVIMGLEEVSMMPERQGVSRRHQGRRQDHPHRWRPGAGRDGHRRHPGRCPPALPTRPSAVSSFKGCSIRKDIGEKALKEQAAATASFEPRKGPGYGMTITRAASLGRRSALKCYFFVPLAEE